MEAIIIECPFGVLAFNNENKLVEKILFPKRPGKAAEIFAKVEGGSAECSISSNKPGSLSKSNSFSHNSS